MVSVLDETSTCPKYSLEAEAVSQLLTIPNEPSVKAVTLATAVSKIL